MRGTHAGAATVGVSVGLLVLSSSTHDGWLVLLAGLGLGLVVTALLLRPRLDSLDVEVGLPPRAAVGDPVDATLSVTNRGRRTSVPLTVTIEATLLSRATVRVPALEPGETAHADIGLVAGRRGDLAAVIATLHTTAPFSLIAVLARRAVAAPMLVHPALGQALPAHVGGTGDLAVTTSRAPGVEVQGIREWHRGEATGRLYARGTARHGRPLVLDRHDELGVPGFAVVVGGPDDLSPATIALQEAMISIVAATMLERAADGRQVTAITHQPGLPPITTADPTELLDWCARLARGAQLGTTDVAYASDASGPGGDVVVAALATAPNQELLAAAGGGLGTERRLVALHRMRDRTDALCLHAVNAPSDAVGASDPSAVTR